MFKKLFVVFSFLLLVACGDEVADRRDAYVEKLKANGIEFNIVAWNEKVSRLKGKRNIVTGEYPKPPYSLKYEEMSAEDVREVALSVHKKLALLEAEIAHLEWVQKNRRKEKPPEPTLESIGFDETPFDID